MKTISDATRSLVAFEHECTSSRMPNHIKGLSMLLDLATRALHFLPPERAHDVVLRAAKSLPMPVRKFESSRLAQEIWGMHFCNPLGLAAGFDKDAEVYEEILHWGFGFVEVGTVTPIQQVGNVKPRVFRLDADGAIINRMGFNNFGHEHAIERLSKRKITGIVGVNIGKNKNQTDHCADYVAGVLNLGKYANYITVNISSPNTPGLRSLQDKLPLTELIIAVKSARASINRSASLPILIKVAPDLTPKECDEISEVAIEYAVDGLIVSNTTISRPDCLQSPHKSEAGGLSGRPLFDMSTEILAQFYRLTRGAIPLIGVGGIFSGTDAYLKIRAGASLVQIYTALILKGPNVIADILEQLDECLLRDGFSNIRQAIGAGLPSRS